MNKGQAMNNVQIILRLPQPQKFTEYICSVYVVQLDWATEEQEGVKKEMVEIAVKCQAELMKKRYKGKQKQIHEVSSWT